MSDQNNSNQAEEHRLGALGYKQELSPFNIGVWVAIYFRL